MDRGGETFGGNETIAAAGEFGHFVPIHLAHIEAEGNPASGAHVGRQVEAFGTRRHQGGVVSLHDFAAEGNDAVAVMVIEEPGEGLLADEECGMQAGEGTGGLGEGETDPAHAGEAGVFALGLGHLSVDKTNTKCVSGPAAGSNAGGGA